MIKKNHLQAGFTLIEIIIAITLLAFLMLSVYTIVDNSTNTKERITAEDRDYLQVEAFFARFDTDFSQIYSPLYFEGRAKKKASSHSSYDESSILGNRFETYSESGLPIPIIDSPSKGKLIFMTSSHRRRIQGAKESNYAWISYETRDSVGENPVAPYIIVRNYQADDVYARDFKWDENKDQIVLKNVKEIEFGFWDESKKNFVSSVRELGEANKNLLRLVRVRLVWLNKDGVEYKFEKTFRPLYPVFKNEAANANTTVNPMGTEETPKAENEQ